MIKTYMVYAVRGGRKTPYELVKTVTLTRPQVGQRLDTWGWIHEKNVLLGQLEEYGLTPEKVPPSIRRGIVVQVE